MNTEFIERCLDAAEAELPLVGSFVAGENSYDVFAYAGEIYLFCTGSEENNSDFRTVRTVREAAEYLRKIHVSDPEDQEIISEIIHDLAEGFDEPIPPIS